MKTTTLNENCGVMMSVAAVRDTTPNGETNELERRQALGQQKFVPFPIRCSVVGYVDSRRVMPLFAH